MPENNESIGKISTPMTIEEAIVKSSIQIITMENGSLIPSGFGSGFIVAYKERLFLITVYHVIKDDQRQFYLETDQHSENGSILKPVGGFCHFEKIKLTEGMDPEDLIQALNSTGEHIDIAFTEVKPPLDLFQQEINFQHFKIEKGPKIFIGMETATDPKPDESFGFFGKIQQQVRGKLLYSRPTFKHSLKFHRTAGQFHIFLEPEKEIVSNEYEGCSGAPILDWEGNIVAIACKAMNGAKTLFGFSILECKKLLNLAIESGLL